MASLLALLALLIAAQPAARAGSDSVTASTTLAGSSVGKKNNVTLACQALSSITLEYGDTFSFNDWLGPRSAQAGYVSAKNGRGVYVVGGGVAQVATTMYLALLQVDDIEYNSLFFYGDKFSDNYVSDGYYAVATDYDDNIDFSFTSYYPGSLTIFIWEDGSAVTCLILMDSGSSNNSLVGYAATPLYGTDAKINNIALAASSIFGASFQQYDMFSFNTLVGPRLAQYGYQNAVNGRGVTVVGGGVAQVASTVYLAVKDLDNVTVSEKKTYSNFTEYYVDDPGDAILTDYTGAIDFAFYYTGGGTLVLYTYLSDTECICEVYEY